MSLISGTKLGPFEILAPLGAGGMGEVYRARDTRLGREVAIKVLPERLAGDPTALSRFEREARAVAALSHPNILAIHDFGNERGIAYSVTELLAGETLRQRLSEGPLSLRKATEHGVQIATGLAAAHEAGIVHRDLKPENVFITKDDRVKILDFGLAKPAAGSSMKPGETQSPTASAYTEPGAVVGTVGYMSPEQVRGHAVDRRSDIFSFGAVLFEMLTGRRALSAGDRRRDDDGDSQGRAAGARRRGEERSSGVRFDRSAVSGQEAREAFSVGRRSRLCARCGPLRIRRDRACCDHCFATEAARRRPRWRRSRPRGRRDDRRLPSSFLSRELSRAGLGRRDVDTVDDRSGLRGGADVLARRTDDCLRRRP